MLLVSVAASLLLAFAASEDLRVNLGDLPMQNPDLFQGDILGIFGPDDKNAIPDEKSRWPQATVPYVIDSSLEQYTASITEAMEDYHAKTCVRFKPKTEEKNYIRLFAGRGCYSYVGMSGGSQPVSLGRGCIYRGTIVHELGHALGFFHEQNRSDRDEYLIIYWQNIQTGMETQFALLKPNDNLLLDTFDYNSIMLYGNTAFSKDGVSDTMVARTGQTLLETYEKSGLSPSDVTRVRKMYNC